MPDKFHYFIKRSVLKKKKKNVFIGRRLLYSHRAVIGLSMILWYSITCGRQVWHYVNEKHFSLYTHQLGPFIISLCFQYCKKNFGKLSIIRVYTRKKHTVGQKLAISMDRSKHLMLRTKNNFVAHHKEFIHISLFALQRMVSKKKKCRRKIVCTGASQ